MLLVANLANTKYCKKNGKITENLAHGYSSEYSVIAIQWIPTWLSKLEVFKNLCVLVLWKKVASALEGLQSSDHLCAPDADGLGSQNVLRGLFTGFFYFLCCQTWPALPGSISKVRCSEFTGMRHSPGGWLRPRWCSLYSHSHSVGVTIIKK